MTRPEIHFESDLTIMPVPGRNKTIYYKANEPSIS